MLIEQIEQLCDRVGVPRRLSQLGVTREQIPAIVKSSRGSSMSGNPRELSDEELAKDPGGDPVSRLSLREKAPPFAGAAFPTGNPCSRCNR